MHAIGGISSHQAIQGQGGTPRAAPPAQKGEQENKIGAPPDSGGQGKDTKHTLNVEA